ncbi:hypothetical protein [Bdellovibrio sp. KM01]|nr:hypothetical protein [Bdellovibrio sp. KM01]QLY24708.1 hypothetical protein HW988_14800 [Bdellovibrio sp. KM01]
MKKVLSILAITIAMACAACAPVAEDDGSTTTDQVFPNSLKFVTPAGVQ